MPSGEAFEDVTGLKQIMTRDPDKFSRNLTRKLLTYATGRTMQAADRPEIDRIAGQMTKVGTRLRDLIKLVVTSNSFRTK